MQTDCVGWRAARKENCDPDGERYPGGDRHCFEFVPRGEPGFCECAGGAVAARVECEHAPFTCAHECRRQREVRVRGRVDSLSCTPPSPAATAARLPGSPSPLPTRLLRLNPPSPPFLQMRRRLRDARKRSSGVPFPPPPPAAPPAYAIGAFGTSSGPGGGVRGLGLLCSDGSRTAVVGVAPTFNDSRGWWFVCPGWKVRAKEKRGRRGCSPDLMSSVSSVLGLGLAGEGPTAVSFKAYPQSQPIHLESRSPHLSRTRPPDPPIRLCRRPRRSACQMPFPVPSAPPPTPSQVCRYP
jgi:hypothetical protein